MRLNTADAAFLVGDAAALAAMPGTPPLEPFSPRVLDLFDALSKALLSRPEARRFPDLAALAFWCRRAAMEERESPTSTGNSAWGGDGAAHRARATCPSTSPIRWRPGCSQATRTRCGCPPSPSRRRRSSAPRWRSFSPARFPTCGPTPPVCAIRAKAASPRRFPALCDARIIWGQGTRRDPPGAGLSAKAPRGGNLLCRPLVACVIESGAYLDHAEPGRARPGLLQRHLPKRPAFLCRPRAVLWLGERAGEARSDFWPRVEALAAAEYDWPAALAVAKREAFCRIAADCPGARLLTRGNLLVRVELPRAHARRDGTPSGRRLLPRGGGGFP